MPASEEFTSTAMWCSILQYIDSSVQGGPGLLGGRLEGIDRYD